MEKRYLVGATKDSPLYSIHVGGVCFPRYSETVTYDPETGNTLRYPNMGNVVELTDDQVKTIKQIAFNSKFFRSKGKRCFAVSKHTKGYRKQGVEIPYAKYIYMVPIRDGEYVAREYNNTPTPPTLFDQQKESKAKGKPGKGTE